MEQAIPAGPGRHPAILLLHGSGGNTGFWLERIAPFLGRLNIAIFAPHYFDSTGTIRAESAQLFDGIHVPLWLEAVQDAITHVAANPAVDPRRIALVGISLGGFLSLALGTILAGKRKLRAIVEVSGGLAAPWDLQATSDFPPTLILHGDTDTVVPVANAHNLDTLLTGLKVPHEKRILAGEGHWFSSGGQMQLLGAIAPFLGRYL